MATTPVKLTTAQRRALYGVSRARIPKRPTKAMAELERLGLVVVDMFTRAPSLTEDGRREVEAQRLRRRV